MKKPKRKGERIISIVLNDNTIKKLTEIAHKNNRSRSGQIREILENVITTTSSHNEHKGAK